MIITNIATGNQMLNTKWTCSTDAQVIQIPQTPETLDFCFCQFVPDCSEDAFVFPEDEENRYKNDYKLFINNLLSNSSTCVYTLISEDGTETVLDATYGTVFSAGFNEDQPLMVGYQIEWSKVVSNLGYGKYYIRTTQTDFNVDYVTESQTFQTKLYTEERIDGTVRLELEYNGMIQNGTNFKGVNKLNMIRVKGYFGDKSPQIEKNSTETTSREVVDIQTMTYNNYTLNIDLIPKEVSTFLLDEGILLKWFITDYNIGNQEDYRNKELILESVENNETKNTRLTSVTCVLRDVQSKVYRPFI